MYEYINYYDNDFLAHHGIKGMKWGVRRYQNKDGSLTPEGLKKYRKEYDNIKQEQILSERSKNINGIKTSIKSINTAVNEYNSRYYDRNAYNKLKSLTRKIGDRGLSQLDAEVIREGKTAAEKAKRKAEEFNKTIDLSVDDNYLFLRNPQRDYEYEYNRYLENNLVKK